MMLFQYFIEVVPTDIEMFMRTTKTFQYSVKDHESPVGFPGIFFKYDTSALKVKVTQERDSIGQFLVKLCATVGCIFVTNGKEFNFLQINKSKFKIFYKNFTLIFNLLKFMY